MLPKFRQRRIREIVILAVLASSLLGLTATPALAVTATGTVNVFFGNEAFSDGGVVGQLLPCFTPLGSGGLVVQRACDPQRYWIKTAYSDGSIALKDSATTQCLTAVSGRYGSDTSVQPCGTYRTRARWIPTSTPNGLEFALQSDPTLCLTGYAIADGNGNYTDSLFPCAGAQNQVFTSASRAKLQLTLTIPAGTSESVLLVMTDAFGEDTYYGGDYSASTIVKVTALSTGTYSGLVATNGDNLATPQSPRPAVFGTLRCTDANPYSQNGSKQSSCLVAIPTTIAWDTLGAYSLTF